METEAQGVKILVSMDVVLDEGVSLVREISLLTNKSLTILEFQKVSSANENRENYRSRK